MNVLSKLDIRQSHPGRLKNKRGERHDAHSLLCWEGARLNQAWSDGAPDLGSKS